MDCNQPSAVTLFSHGSMECQIMAGNPSRQGARTGQDWGVSEAVAPGFECDASFVMIRDLDLSQYPGGLSIRLSACSLELPLSAGPLFRADRGIEL